MSNCREAVLVGDLVGGFKGDCRGAILVSGFDDKRFWWAVLVVGGFAHQNRPQNRLPKPPPKTAYQNRTLKVPSKSPSTKTAP